LSPTRLLEPPAGYASREVASFMAQLDDQTRRLREDTRGLPEEALSWQLAPGMNTIGMLLAHIAIVEVYWIAILSGEPEQCERVIGMDIMGDGMPIAADGLAPDSLAGKPLAFYDRMLSRARAYARRRVRRLGPAALAGKVRRTRQDGEVWTHSRRWILYHLLEHFAGHYGQILLLRHRWSALHGAETEPRRL
jgi:uncharacterized damage-inducible protein DinB